MKDGLYRVKNPDGLEFEDEVDGGVTLDGFWVHELIQMGYEFTLLEEYPEDEEEE